MKNACLNLSISCNNNHEANIRNHIIGDKIESIQIKIQEII